MKTIKAIAERIAMDKYPDTIVTNHNTERKWFIEGFIKGAQDIQDGCYIKHELKYSYVYNEYVESGKELRTIINTMLPSGNGVYIETVKYLRQFIVRGYEEAENWKPLINTKKYGSN